MEAAKKAQENKMGVMPVNRLLIGMSLPMMISMLVQALYNIIDSIYVSRIGEKALTAVSLAFPLQTLMIAFGVGTGVGINAVLSKALGEGDLEKANKAAENGVFLDWVNHIIFLLAGLFLTTPFYVTQTPDREIIEYGRQYLPIICCFSLGMYAQYVFDRLLQSTGKTIYTMLTQGMGAVINIFLDPVFIFGYFGIPGMGVRGAAIATVISQTIAGTASFVINRKKNTEIRLRIRGFKPDPDMIGQIYRVGIPTIIMQSIGSVMSFGVNRILLAFTSTAAAVFGIYFKLQNFVFLPVFGLNNGVIPIVAYNFGAKDAKRLLQTVKLGICYAVCLMAFGFGVFQLFPSRLLLLFDASKDMLAIGVPALRIISLSFILAGFGVVGGAVFQALGNGMYSLMVSAARQLLVLLPAAYFLARRGNLGWVWWAFPIAELVSMGVSVFFFVRIYRRVIKEL